MLMNVEMYATNKLKSHTMSKGRNGLPAEPRPPVMLKPRPGFLLIVTVSYKSNKILFRMANT